MTRGRAYAVVAAAAVLPRLAVLLYERGDILTRLRDELPRVEGLGHPRAA